MLFLNILAVVQAIPAEFVVNATDNQGLVSGMPIKSDPVPLESSYHESEGPLTHSVNEMKVDEQELNLRVFSDEKITAADAYLSVISTADFVKGLAHTIHSSKGNSRAKAKDSPTKGLHFVGANAVMHLVDGDPRKFSDENLFGNWSDEKVVANLGVPKIATCLEISTSDQKHSVQIAYGANPYAVRYLDCSETDFTEIGSIGRKEDPN